MFKKTLLISSILLTLNACSDNNENKEQNNLENKETVEVAKETKNIKNEEKVIVENNDTKYVEGTHYRKLENPIVLDDISGDHIIEYFWLACPHCQNFEPMIQMLDKELKDVEVVKRHAALGKRWAKDAALYYNMKELGHNEHLYDLFMFYKDLGQKEQRLPEIEDIKRFLDSKKINSEEFFKNASSSKITKKIEETINEMKSNEINGVPAVVVNGKYLINNGKLPAGTDYKELVQYLTDLK